MPRRATGRERQDQAEPRRLQLVDAVREHPPRQRDDRRERQVDLARGDQQRQPRRQDEKRRNVGEK
jgi:hypothetical protein